MDVFPGYAVNVSRRDLFDSGAIALQEVRRIAVKLIAHAFGQDLLLGVEFEDEGVQDGVLGFLQFFRLYRTMNQAVDLFLHGFNARGGASALSAHVEVSDAGMIESRTYAAANVVGEPLAGANADKQA